MGPAIPIIAVVATVAGTVLSGVASAQQSKFQAKVAEMNADINKENAVRARERAAIEAQEQDQLSRSIIGEEISNQSGSGLSLESGSFTLRRKSQQELARSDALRIVQGGEVEAHNFLVEAANQRAEASLARHEARSTLIGTGISAVGSLASGFSGGGSGGGGLSSLVSSAPSSGGGFRLPRRPHTGSARRSIV